MESHTHNGTDSPRVDVRELEGSYPIVATAPTKAAPEGSIVFYSSGGVYRIYVRLNKGWRLVALT